MINKETSRKITGIILAAVILLVGFSSPVRNYVELPNELRLIKGDKLEVHPFLPVELHILNQDQILSVNGQQITDQTPAAVGLTEPLKLSSLDVGNVKVEFRLFGYVPLRTMEINVIEDRELVPGGEAIGIKAGTSEIVVSDYFYLETENGEMSPAKKSWHSKRR
ncbi:hypothetical protein [Natranaerobius thermophilus]|uniref:hypothetical protein n=1 Tax=Natranaerobius thermophilus TaxID=375929 RepID=UPI002F40A5DC